MKATELKLRMAAAIHKLRGMVNARAACIHLLLQSAVRHISRAKLVFSRFISHIFGNHEFICKYMKGRPLSQWLLRCHPNTQMTCCALPPLTAHVAAWAHTVLFSFPHLIHFLFPVCLKMYLEGSILLALLNTVMGRFPISSYLKNTEK